MEKEKPIISVEEYRRLLNDYESSDERIVERLRYIEALCRNVIRAELAKMKTADKLPS